MNVSKQYGITPDPEVLDILHTVHRTKGPPTDTGVIITEGESSWRQLKFPYQVNFQYGSETVFLDGAFHWMIDTEDKTHPTTLLEQILALDVSNEEFHTISIPPSIVLPDSLILINLAGVLLGSDSNYIVTNASCPVTFVKGLPSEAGNSSLSLSTTKQTGRTNVVGKKEEEKLKNNDGRN
ncbi:hypothetical protein IFM89_027703 [Coptis chinensis]|uniref:Uncharacterized protein n=1 Tax=Coptis chinensis TaxID=261450 RepID=A0A835HWU7_9MAGN|nr:hypothetical protein IFM89_027703 [Coptis chinensis]